jgi:tripartite-type tricarboxylate transporter receptor subunit TctC
MKTLVRIWVASVTSFVAAMVHAQAFPSKPIRLIVPFPAGGTVDGLARNLQQGLAAALGQTVVVDNKTGANGRIGTSEGAKAPADGHTIVMIYDNYATDPVIYKDLPYDPWKDFIPVSMVARAPMVAIAAGGTPYNDLKELVAFAKANPGKVDFGSTGLGSSSHLMAELFAQASEIKMFHIPYKGGAPAANELLGGTLQLFWGTVPYAKGLAASGKVKLLGQTGRIRAAALRDVPTLAEQGFSNVEVYGWAGFVLPAGTPRAIVDRWRAAIHTAATAPAVVEKLSTQGFEISPNSPEEFMSFIRGENKKWGELITAAKIPLQ